MNRFCKINVDVYFFKDLIDKLNESLFVKGSISLLSLYEELNNNYCTQHKSVLNFTKQLIPTDTNVNTLGIDLPAWFGNLKKCEKKIMIIGVDPMRNKKDFRRVGADYKEDVIIGTPYSFHLEKMWNNAGKYKYYSQFITSLSKNNFIYLTDVYKTFFYYEKLRSYKFYAQTNNKLRNKKSSNIFHDLLEEEINIIKPDVIITLGAISYYQLTNNSDKIRSHVNNKISYGLSTKFYHNKCGDRRIPIYPLIHLAAWKKNLMDFRNKHLNESKSEDFGIVLFEILKKYNAV